MLYDGSTPKDVDGNDLEVTNNFYAELLRARQVRALRSLLVFCSHCSGPQHADALHADLRKSESWTRFTIASLIWEVHDTEHLVIQDVRCVSARMSSELSRC